VGIAGRQWHLPANRSKMRLHRKSSVPTHAAVEIQELAGAFDLLLGMVKVPLDWAALINALVPNSRLDFVGVKFAPISAEYTG
jgi:hypothetical protein